MYYDIFTIICNFLYGADAVISSTTYEYWVACVLSATACIMVVYLPFCIVRWFFRGIAK